MLVKFRVDLALSYPAKSTVKPANLMGYLYLKNLLFKNVTGGGAEDDFGGYKTLIINPVI